MGLLLIFLFYTQAGVWPVAFLKTASFGELPKNDLDTWLVIIKPVGTHSMCCMFKSQCDVLGVMSV